MQESKRQREESVVPEGKAAKASKTAPKQDASTEVGPSLPIWHCRGALLTRGSFVFVRKSKAAKRLDPARLNKRYLADALDSIWSDLVHEKGYKKKDKCLPPCDERGVLDNGTYSCCKRCTLSMSARFCAVCADEGHVLLECPRVHAETDKQHQEDVKCREARTWLTRFYTSSLWFDSCMDCHKDRPDCLRLIPNGDEKKKTTICSVCVATEAVCSSTVPEPDRKAVPCDACPNKTAVVIVGRRACALCQQCVDLVKKAATVKCISAEKRKRVTDTVKAVHGNCGGCGKQSVPVIPDHFSKKTWCTGCIHKDELRYAKGGQVCNFCLAVVEHPNTMLLVAGNCLICLECTNYMAIVGKFEKARKLPLPRSWSYECALCSDGYRSPSLLWSNAEGRVGSICCRCVCAHTHVAAAAAVGAHGKVFCVICHNLEAGGFTAKHDLTGATVTFCADCSELARSLKGEEWDDDTMNSDDEGGGEPSGDEASGGEEKDSDSDKDEPMGLGKGLLKARLKAESAAREAEEDSDKDDVPSSDKLKGYESPDLVVERAAAAAASAAGRSLETGIIDLSAEEAEEEKAAVAADDEVAVISDDDEEVKAAVPVSNGKEEKKAAPAAVDPAKVCAACEKSFFNACNDVWDHEGNQTLCGIHRLCYQRWRLRAVALTELEEAVGAKFGAEGKKLVAEHKATLLGKVGDAHVNLRKAEKSPPLQKKKKQLPGAVAGLRMHGGCLESLPATHRIKVLVDSEWTILPDYYTIKELKAAFPAFESEFCKVCTKGKA